MAQRGINKVILVGNTGADPESRAMPNGNQVTNLRIATSEVWKDQSGQQQERTEWHTVVLFGKIAEIASQYVTKGSKVYIEGKLTTRKWQDQSGADRYTTEVVVDQRGVMQILDSRQSNQQNAGQNNTNGQNNPNGNGQQQQNANQNQNGAQPNGAPRNNNPQNGGNYQQTQPGGNPQQNGGNYNTPNQGQPDNNFDYDQDIPF